MITSYMLSSIGHAQDRQSNRKDIGDGLRLGIEGRVATVSRRLLSCGDRNALTLGWVKWLVGKGTCSQPDAAAMLDDQRFIPGTHRSEGENGPLQVIL